MRCADKYNTPFIPHVETQDVQHSHASELIGYILFMSCAALMMQDLQLSKPVLKQKQGPYVHCNKV